MIKMANLKKGYQPKGKLGSGSRFKAVSGNVASEYVKKGFSAKKANAIGGAIAANAGRKKFGKAKFQGLAAKGKK